MKETPIFSGYVKDGRLALDNKQAFENFLLSLKGRVSVEIRQWTNRRSLDQNALLWLYYGIIANDTGHSPDEVHELAKRYCLDPQFIEWQGKTIKIPGSTTKLSKTEFGEYLDRIAIWSGVPVPQIEIK